MQVKKMSLACGVIAALLSVSNSHAVSLTTPVKLTVEAAVVDAVVPTALTINMDSKGIINTATNAKITNNSQGPIKVSNVNIAPKSSWSIVNFDSDFNGFAVDSKKLGLKINGDKTEDGNFTWTNSSQIIPGKGGSTTPEMPITYEAKLPLQAALASDVNIADVVFTIDWYK